MTDRVGGEDAVARTTGRSVLGGGMWYLLARAAPQLYTVAVSVAAARFLGAEGLGRQSFISFVALSTAMVVGGGFPSRWLATWARRWAVPSPGVSAG